MDTPDDCAREEAPGFLATHAARLFTRAVDRELRPFGLSVAGLPPLLLLAAGGPMRQRDLLRRAAIAQPAMVAALARLEAQGLVARQADATDGRAALLRLTPRGEEAVARAGPALARGNERALGGFSADERAMLVGLLGRMIANLGGAGEKHQG